MKSEPVKSQPVKFVPAVAAPAALSARTRCFVVRQLGLVVRSEGAQVFLPELSELPRLGLSTADLQYLGRLHEEDCFALDAGRAELSAPWAVQSLRSLYDQLTEEEFGVAGRAVQIATFAVTHRFCGGCGQPTTRDAVERCVRCRSCDLVFYPRVSPAIIVLVRRGQEALLASSARFATGFYSTLAGFVEPGESLEQTLVREVFEEVGIQVENVRYFGTDLSGVRLVANDWEWSLGDGAPLHGNAQDLLLVICGRRIPENLLEGTPSARFAGRDAEAG